MRSVKIALVTAFAVLAVTVAYVGTASAASCPSTYACGWVDAGFGVDRGQWAGTNPNFGVFAENPCQTNTWNNCISSDANSGTQCRANFWTLTSYSGSAHSVARGSFESYVGDFFNDTFSSNNWTC
jgi:hypothetical protein